MKSLSIQTTYSYCRFGLSTVALAALVAGCTSEPSNEDPGVATIAILGESGDNADESDLGRMRGAGLGLIDGLPGLALKCDAEPEITQASVCGVELPTGENYSWTDCKMSNFGQGKGKGKGGPVSSGNIEIRHDVEGTTADCDGTTALTFSDSTDLAVQRIMPNGRAMTLTGSISATSTHSANATIYTKEVEISALREMSDEDGTLLRHVEIKGTASVAFAVDANGTVRVINGQLTADLGDGDTHEVALVGVTRRDNAQCRWPVAGTLTRVETDGTSHELVFSSTCGQATLDGASIDLNAQRGHGKHGRGKRMQ